MSSSTQNGVLTPEERKQRKSALAPAIALRWDEKNVTVFCPFCWGTHDHGHELIRYTKESPLGKFCPPSPYEEESQGLECAWTSAKFGVKFDYAVVFPYEEDERVEGLSYKIEEVQPNGDEHMIRFCTVGLDEGRIVTRHIYKRESLEQKTKRLKELEADRLVSDFKQISIGVGKGDNTSVSAVDFWSSCATGDIAVAKDLLGKYENAFLALRNYAGETGLHLAILDGHFSIAELLINEGADVDCINLKGRTPLMEAALWGHVRIVKLLLEHSANKTMRDNNSMTALELAEEWEKNEEERSMRTPEGKLQPSEEEEGERRRRPITQLDRIRRRRVICHLLDPQQPLPNTRLGTGWDEALFFRKMDKSDQGGTVSFVLPTHRAIITTADKTTAVLHRGGPHPLIYASSG
jgi:hypothetical protein